MSDAMQLPASADCPACGGDGWYLGHDDACYEDGDCSCAGKPAECECGALHASPPPAADKVREALAYYAADGEGAWVLMQTRPAREALAALDGAVVLTADQAEELRNRLDAVEWLAQKVVGAHELDGSHGWPAAGCRGVIQEVRAARTLLGADDD